MLSVPETTPSVPELMKIVRELIEAAKMSKKLKKDIKKTERNSLVQLFSIGLLSNFNECAGTFGSCTHDYDICNDDKKEC